jgi:hypothetical protein
MGSDIFSEPMLLWHKRLACVIPAYAGIQFVF